MAGGLPSLSSYIHPSQSTGYVNHYGTVADPFTVKVKKSTIANQRAAALAAHQHHGSSLLGDILGVGGNLLGDAKDMAYGVIPGTIAAVEHPGTAGKAILNDYETRYGRILHGDFSDVAKHPLSYILDAATIASGGAGALAKAGQVGKVAEAAAAGSRTAKYLNDIGKARETAIGLTRKSEKTIPVNLSGHPYVRMRQRALLRLQSAPGVSKTPVFGLEAKARRTMIGQQRKFEAQVRNTQPAYERSIKKLNTATKIHTFDVISRGTSPADELNFYYHPDIHGQLSPEAKAIRSHLASPEVNNLYQEVTHHLKANPSNPLLAETKHLSKPAQDIISALRHHEKLVTQDTAMRVKAGRITAETALARRVAHLRIQDEVHGRPVKTPEEYMAAAKRRTGILPQYSPDKMEFGSALGKGEFKGSIYKAGTRNPNPELAIASHDHAANITSIGRAHDVLSEAAQHFPVGTDKPKNYVWLRETHPIHDFIGVNLDRFSKETQPYIESAMHGAAKERGVDPREMYFESLTQGAPNSARKAVPKSLAQEMVDRHIRAVGTPSEMLRKATAMWKGSILAARPAFVSNNVIGNQALYYLRHGFGVRANKALFTAKRDRPALEEFLNEHNQTFGHAEKFLHPGKIGKVGNAFYKGVGVHELWLRTATMRAHALKIPEVRQELRSLKGGKFDPAAHGGRTMFHEALSRAIQKNPAIRDEIGRVIDDTMGNYRYYNKFEENLRQIVPFYGWNRHSVRSFERLLADRPAFAQAIAEVSHQGNKNQQHDFPGVPEFMRSYLKAHLPGGINAIDTHSLNPMLGATDTIDAARQALHPGPGNVDQIAGIINPILTDAVQSMTGTNLATGAPIKKTALDGLPAGKLLGQVLEGLPETKIGAHLAGTDQPNKNSPTYKYTPTGRDAKHKTPMLTQSNTGLIASFLGLPGKQLNLKAAQEFEKKLKTTQQGKQFHTATVRKRKATSNNFFNAP